MKQEAKMVVVVIAALGALALYADVTRVRVARLEHRVEVAEARATLAFRAVGQCATNDSIEPLKKVLVAHDASLVDHNKRIRAFEREYPLGTR